MATRADLFAALVSIKATELTTCDEIADALFPLLTLQEAPGDERLGDIRRWRKRLDNKGSTWSHERVGTEFATALEAVDYLLSLFAAAPTLPVGEAPRVDADDRTDALHDSAYLAGLKEGWNCGVDEDRGRYQRIVDSRAGYLKPLATPPSPSPTPAQIDAAATRVWEIMSRKGPVEPGTDHERIVRVLTALVTTPAPYSLSSGTRGA